MKIINEQFKEFEKQSQEWIKRYGQEKNTPEEIEKRNSRIESMLFKDAKRRRHKTLKEKKPPKKFDEWANW